MKQRFTQLFDHFESFLKDNNSNEQEVDEVETKLNS